VYKGTKNKLLGIAFIKTYQQHGLLIKEHINDFNPTYAQVNITGQYQDDLT
jgi:hypothetical protein